MCKSSFWAIFEANLSSIEIRQILPFLLHFPFENSSRPILHGLTRLYKKEKSAKQALAFWHLLI